MTVEPAVLRDILDYEPDTGVLRWKRRDVASFASEHAAKIWNAKYPGTRALANKNRGGYLKGLIFGRTYIAHRIIWAWVSGEYPPDGLEIDHINRVRDDNRLSNLRIVTHSQNSLNRGRRGSTIGRAA
jgi:hypothetical protein